MTSPCIPSFPLHFIALVTLPVLSHPFPSVLTPYTSDKLSFLTYRFRLFPSVPSFYVAGMTQLLFVLVCESFHF